MGTIDRLEAFVRVGNPGFDNLSPVKRLQTLRETVKANPALLVLLGTSEFHLEGELARREELWGRIEKVKAIRDRIDRLGANLPAEIVSAAAGAAAAVAAAVYGAAAAPPFPVAVRLEVTLQPDGTHLVRLETGDAARRGAAAAGQTSRPAAGGGGRAAGEIFWIVSSSGHFARSESLATAIKAVRGAESSTYVDDGCAKFCGRGHLAAAMGRHAARHMPSCAIIRVRPGSRPGTQDVVIEYGNLWPGYAAGAPVPPAQILAQSDASAAATLAADCGVSAAAPASGAAAAG